MPVFAIESNGRIEKTAIYYNGEQIGGVREIFLNLDEDGTFDAVMQYQGHDGEIYTKQIFADNLPKLRYVEPSFTEDEAQHLVLFELESDGDIESCLLLLNEEELEGVVNVLLHVKAVPGKSGFGNLFKKRKTESEEPVFKAQITYRNDDDSIETEDIF